MPVTHAVVFDLRSIWVTEFARALSTRVATTGLRPVIDAVGLLHRAARPLEREGALEIFSCRLQRGWWRSALLSESRKLEAFVRSRAPFTPETCVIFTSPHYASVADAFRECTRAYYVSDNFRACFPNEQVIATLEMRLAEKVNHVFPNSDRIRRFFTEEAGIEDHRVTVIPNGVRSENIPPAPLEVPSEPPAEMPPVPRPWALVMGNLAANTDWPLLQAVIGETPWLNWVLVGPTDMPCASQEHERIRSELLRAIPRVHHLGWQPPAALMGFARACDVAVLPYMKREPTYSGSSTRSYEHFAACRPIVSSDGFAELLERQPLVTVCRSSAEMMAALEKLRRTEFRDGHEAARWQLARNSTWGHRAAAMLEVLNQAKDRPLPSAGLVGG